MGEWKQVSDVLWTTVNDQGRMWGISHLADIANPMGKYMASGPGYEATEHATWDEAAEAVSAIIDT